MSKPQPTPEQLECYRLIPALAELADMLAEAGQLDHNFVLNSVAVVAFQLDQDGAGAGRAPYQPPG